MRGSKEEAQKVFLRNIEYNTKIIPVTVFCYLLKVTTTTVEIQPKIENDAHGASQTRKSLNGSIVMYRYAQNH